MSNSLQPVVTDQQLATANTCCIAGMVPRSCRGGTLTARRRLTLHAWCMLEGHNSTHTLKAAAFAAAAAAAAEMLLPFLRLLLLPKLQVMSPGTYDVSLFYTSTTRAVVRLYFGTYDAIVNGTARSVRAELPWQVSIHSVHMPWSVVLPVVCLHHYYCYRGTSRLLQVGVM